MTKDTFSIFRKSLPGIITPTKDELIILGAPLGLKSQAENLDREIIEQQKCDRIFEKLDALYGFSC